jgi:hypothetical protein
MNPKLCGEPPRDGHRGLFAADETDDVLLRFCGERNWVVVSQDYRYHLEANVREAIKQHRVGVFYIWGANATKWDTFRVLAHAFPKLVTLTKTTDRPFIFKIAANARFYPVDIDGRGKRRQRGAANPA